MNMSVEALAHQYYWGGLQYRCWGVMLSRIADLILVGKVRVSADVLIR